MSRATRIAPLPVRGRQAPADPAAPARPLEDLEGKEATKTLGRRFDVAVRRPNGGDRARRAARRNELEAVGMQQR